MNNKAFIFNIMMITIAYTYTLNRIALFLCMCYRNRNWLPLSENLGSAKLFFVISVAHLFSFLCFLFCWSSFCAMCPVLLVSLDCPFFIVPFVFSNVYSFLFSFITCFQFKQLYSQALLSLTQIWCFL